jgi:hypothetical protein
MEKRICVQQIIALMRRRNRSQNQFIGLANTFSMQTLQNLFIYLLSLLEYKVECVWRNLSFKWIISD